MDARLRALRARRPDEDIKTFVIRDAEADAVAVTPQRIAEVSRALFDAANAPGYKLPMLPDTAAESMRMANDPTVGMAALERVVGRDTMLATRMLAVANSPAYATGERPRSLTAALQRLGTGAVRDVLYQSVMECHIFRGDDEAFVRAERAHAVYVGHIARLVCQTVGIDPQFAFIVGLLHDIGRIVFRSLANHPELAKADPRFRAAVFSSAHAALGSLMATKWSLPGPVIEGIRRHHRYRDFAADGGYSQIGHVVAVADKVAIALGLGRPEAPLSETDRAVIQEIGVQPDTLLLTARQIVSRF